MSETRISFQDYKVFYTTETFYITEWESSTRTWIVVGGGRERVDFVRNYKYTHIVCAHVVSGY